MSRTSCTLPLVPTAYTAGHPGQGQINLRILSIGGDLNRAYASSNKNFTNSGAGTARAIYKEIRVPHLFGAAPASPPLLAAFNICARKFLIPSPDTVRFQIRSGWNTKG